MDNLNQTNQSPQQPQQVNPIPPAAPAPVEEQPPNPPAGGGWIKWVLIIVVVALLSSTTTYLVLQSQNQTQQSQISPTPTPDLYREPTGSAATANWKTYTYSTFSVRLSDQWIPRKSGEEIPNLAPNLIEAVTFRARDNPYGLYFQVSNDPYLLEELLQYYPKLENIVLDGQPAVKYVVIAGQGADVYQPTIQSNYNGKRFVINISITSDEVRADQEFGQILSTFKFLDQTQTNVDESRVRELISNFYQAFEKQEGELLFGYMTPPITSQEKGEYSWLTGANLGSDAFYRTFLRVKLSNPSIKNVRRLDDKRFEINAVDEFQSYSQVSTQWSGPTVRNVKFTVIKTPSGWVIDKFTYTGTITWTYKGTEKYNGFPNLDSN